MFQASGVPFPALVSSRVAPVLHTHAQSPTSLSSTFTNLLSTLQKTTAQLQHPPLPLPTGPTRHPSGPTPRPRSFSDHQPHSFQESLLNLFSIVLTSGGSQGEVMRPTANREDPAGSPPPPHLRRLHFSGAAYQGTLQELIAHHGEVQDRKTQYSWKSTSLSLLQSRLLISF